MGLVLGMGLTLVIGALAVLAPAILLIGYAGNSEEDELR
jgi:hypothetical protein